jgi:flagellar protein FlaF
LSSTMLAQTAYAATAPVRTSRGTEYAAFQKVTARMIRATRDGASMAERAIALQENRRLWTVLATDLADEANGCPTSCARGCCFWPNSRFSTVVAL